MLRAWMLSVLLLVAGCASKTLEGQLSDQTAARTAAQEQAAKLKQHYLLGEEHYKAGQLDQAELEFKAILDLRADDEAALYRMGTLSFRKANYDESAIYFERVIKVNPRNNKAHYNLASIRLMQAQNHFKYFAALAGKDQDLRGVTVLLGDIDKFNSKGEVSDQSASLDQIAGALKK